MLMTVKAGLGRGKKVRSHEPTGPEGSSHYRFLTSFPGHYRDIDTTNLADLKDFSAPTYEECASKSLVSSPGSWVSGRLRLKRSSLAVKKRSIFDGNRGTFENEENSGELVSEREPIIMCLAKHSVTSDFVREERWQSGRMRIIANDVTPEMGSEGSNPSLSA
jgi:hypothetical protein